MTPNKREPQRLDTGITLIGKRAELPEGIKVGRNCKIGTDLKPENFPSLEIATGETIDSSVQQKPKRRERRGE
jgi:glucose-1-phosphate adenylyltransferase